MEEIIKTMYTCFIVVKNRQSCIRPAPELQREPGINDLESKAFASTLSGRISTVCRTPPDDVAPIRP